VFYGTGKQQLISVEGDEVTPVLESTGVAPRHQVRTGIGIYEKGEIGPIVGSGIGVSASDLVFLKAEYERLVADGYNLVYTANGNPLNIRIDDYRIDPLDGSLSMIEVTWLDGNLAPENGGVAFLNIGVISAVKSLAYADKDSILPIIPSLYNYDNGYKALPQYIDSVTFDAAENSQNITDVDSSGYSRIEPISIELMESKPDWLNFDGDFNYYKNGWWVDVTSGTFSSTLTGQVESAIDKNYGSYYDIDLQANGSFYPVRSAYHMLKLEYAGIKPKDVPPNLFFTADIDAGTLVNTQILEKYKVVVWIDWGFGNTPDSVTPSPLDMPITTYQNPPILDNKFPVFEDYPTTPALSKGFRLNSDWGELADTSPEALNGFSLDLIPLLQPQEDYLLSSGFTVYVGLYSRTKDPVETSVDYRVRDISLIATQAFDTGEIYTDSTGRCETVIDMYRDALKRQCYKANDIEPPLSGWGLDYPTVADWETLYSDSSITGALFGSCYHQYDNAVTTDQIKKDILSHCCCMGGAGSDGIERVYHLTELLFADDGHTIEISGPLSGLFSKKSLPRITKNLPETITPLMSVTYKSSVATGSTTRSIDIIDVANDYSLSSVQSSELTDEQKLELWELGNALYKGWGSVASADQKETDLFLFDNALDAFEYLKRAFALMGARSIFYSGAAYPEAYERFTVEVDLQEEYALSNSLYFGAKVKIKRANNSTLAGVITDTLTINGKTKIVAECVGGPLVGTVSYIIEESGNQADDIEETGSNVTEYIEGD
ncbi:MAG: hypothetical protein GY938_07685, partial [Ketobacter sp.]|nr:hypothetical protein [Ketobacter sp.]